MRITACRQISKMMIETDSPVAKKVDLSLSYRVQTMRNCLGLLKIVRQASDLNRHLINHGAAYV
mgnify:CR=1 FL=1